MIMALACARAGPGAILAPSSLVASLLSPDAAGPGAGSSHTGAGVSLDTPNSEKA